MIFTWASRTDVGRTRTLNEDSLWPTQPGLTGDSLIVAVADGMGGHVAGEVASATAIDAVIGTGGDPALRIQAANVAIRTVVNDRPHLDGMGTTVTLGIFDPEGTLEVGHVGDSRLYRLRDQDLEQLTADHSFVAEMLAAGKMDAETAASHPYRSVLTRSVGVDPDLEVTRYTFDLEVGDRLLFCSDGLNVMLDDEAIHTTLQELNDPDEAVRALIDAANEAGGLDNISAIVVDALDDPAN